MSASEPDTYKAAGMTAPPWSVYASYEDASKMFSEGMRITLQAHQDAIDRAYSKPDPIAGVVAQIVSRADALLDRMTVLEAAQSAKHAALLAAISEEGETL
jgi:hypothetical protein